MHIDLSEKIHDRICCIEGWDKFIKRDRQMFGR